MFASFFAVSDTAEDHKAAPSDAAYSAALLSVATGKGAWGCEPFA